MLSRLLFRLRALNSTLMVSSFRIALSLHRVSTIRRLVVFCASTRRSSRRRIRGSSFSRNSSMMRIRWRRLIRKVCSFNKSYTLSLTSSNPLTSCCLLCCLSCCLSCCLTCSVEQRWLRPRSSTSRRSSFLRPSTRRRPSVMMPPTGRRLPFLFPHGVDKKGRWRMSS